MPLFYMDHTMWILIPAILLTMYAQNKIQKEYRIYRQIQASRGYSGAQVARQILNNNGLSDVEIRMSPGQMSDHYDPKMREVRLSPDVYNGRSLAANAIAAHEVGHAIQHAKAYFPLTLRTNLVPVVRFASFASMPIILAGFVFAEFRGLLDIGILLFCATVLFQLVTLPVEFDASRRAMSQLAQEGILLENELAHSKKVLFAAALTYVAAAATSMLQLMRLIMIRNSHDRRR
ncbi:MAG: zinc metallopeptidase [Peptostreptococcaceae bacterium]|nr:zinc metallopeptidase [Peptostreptococcaceae bacterium]